MSYRRSKDVKAEYLRVKQAMVVFAMCQEKVEQLAKECGAFYKIDRVKLINYEIMKDYIESFKEK